MLAPVMRFDDERRRARLAWRHRVIDAARSHQVERVVEDLVALHSSDPATVHLSVWARMTDPSIAAVERALYDDRTLLRHHAMRRTLWVTTIATAAVAHAACTRRIARAERVKTLRFLDREPVGN